MYLRSEKKVRLAIKACHHRSLLVFNDPLMFVKCLCAFSTSVFFFFAYKDRVLFSECSLGSGKYGFQQIQ